MNPVKTLIAFIDLQAPDEVIEGHYWAPNAAGFSLKLIDEFCPFCSAQLSLVSAPLFGRICQEQGERSAHQAPALVELLPASHEALSCGGCDIVMTRPKEPAR